MLNAYNESMTYDKNGNIKHLNRFGSLTDTAPTQMDNLTYDYKNNHNSNQLAKVSDAVANNIHFKDEFKDSASNTIDDFVYDDNGNLTKDNNKKITNITYNHLNLPTKITFGSTGNIVYIYNAAGQKLEKIVTQGTAVTSTNYLGGYQYLKPNLGTWALQFFPTPEGYVEPSGSSYKYVYQYKDHLGNVRLSYDKNLTIQEESNYYPFGLKHNGYNNVVTSTNSASKYKYNGKELQDELGLNLYDYGARNYDPALGRWMNVDPLAEQYNSWSSYNYTLNNPVLFIDPDGRGVNSTHTDKDGNVIAVFDDGDLGVYKHGDNADGNTPTEYQIAKRHEKSNSAGGEKMGETLTPLGFANFEVYAETGKITPGEGARIDFNSTWATDQVSSILGENPILPRYALNARGGEKWDIKNNTPDGSWYYGSNLFGSYASARDAGNFTAGAVAQMSLYPNSFSDYGFGTYNASGNSAWGSIKMIAKDLMLLGNPTTSGMGAASMSIKANFGENPLSRAGIEAGKTFGKLLTKR